MRISAVLLSALAFGGLTTLAAQPATLRFEVATIRRNDPNTRHMTGVTVDPSGRVVVSGMSLKEMAATAFRRGHAAARTLCGHARRALEHSASFMRMLDGTSRALQFARSSDARSG